MKLNTNKVAAPRKARALQVGLGVLAGVAVGAAATLLSAQPPSPEELSGLPDAPGKDLFASTCSSCHALGLAASKRRSPDEWQEIMERMVGFGATISEADFKTIHAYLAQNLAPVRAAQAPAAPAAPRGPAVARYPRPSGENQWSAYGGGPLNQNFSPLTQITPANVAKLTPAWTYRYGAGRTTGGDQGLDYRFEVTPLMIGGIMYISTPASPRTPNLKAAITAIRPETGEVLWKYESPLNIHGRGIAYWPGDADTAPRIIFATDQGMLSAVDVTTGQLASGFGNKGSIDAYVGVVSEIVGESRRDSFTIPNPVTIYKNLIITGARPGEVGPPAPRGDVRAWDARTGRLVWTFHTIPQPGEPGHEGYKGDEWRDTSGANVWSTMALDPENGIVYAPVGDLNNNTASGSQLYAASILALDASTGKLKWHHQLVHRDLWDFDSPTPPVLFDYTDDNGKKIPAILVTGKQSVVYIFNRLTGETLNGVRERPVQQPAADQGGESWPTQPLPDWPANLARTQMSREEIPDLVPGMKAACTKTWDDNSTVGVPLYAPRQSSAHGVVSYPSGTGGPNWGGGTYNPETGLYVISLKNTAGFRPKVERGAGVGGMNRAPRDPNAAPQPRGQRPPPAFSYSYNGVNLSCGAGPWGELVALDVGKKKIAWRVPLGRFPGLPPAIGDKVGTNNLGGTISTKSGLVFVGAANDRRFRAFDAKTGKKLWEAELEASAHATPISYMGADGKQYVVVAAGGGTSVGGPDMSDTLVAYRLP